jgi:hypothetical protein
MLPKAEPQANVGKGIATVRHKEFTCWIKLICGWDDVVPEAPAKTFRLSPEHFDRRISLQQGVFTFHVPAEPILPEKLPVMGY